MLLRTAISKFRDALLRLPIGIGAGLPCTCSSETESSNVNLLEKFEDDDGTDRKSTKWIERESTGTRRANIVIKNRSYRCYN